MAKKKKLSSKKAKVTAGRKQAIQAIKRVPAEIECPGSYRGFTITRYAVTFTSGAVAPTNRTTLNCRLHGKTLKATAWPDLKRQIDAELA